MAKSKSYSCSDCGAVTNKWSGRCDSCEAWNTISEDTALSSGPSKTSLGAKKGSPVQLSNLDTDEAPNPRTQSGIDELDRVLGGGLVPASAILVGGDPGIGKSTLLLQAAAQFAHNGLKTIYISGEEASAQVRMRAQRLGLKEAPIQLGAETNLRNILTTLDSEKPKLVIIDSIQTIWSDHVDSAPGSVSQVRAAAHELTNFAKKRGISVVLVGHVTKEGQIAGPRVVEHMVDTVLYFEGERGHQFRILRAVKNRFGAADEIGVFEMTGKGLQEISNRPYSFRNGEPQAQVRWCLLEWKARARFWLNFRPSWPRLRTRRPAARWSDGIMPVWQWSWRCSKPVVAFHFQAWTSI